MSRFIEWLEKGSKEVQNVEIQVVRNTLTCYIITLSDDRVFVSADRGLVSYDCGYYEPYVKESNIDNIIEKMINKYYLNM